MKIDRIKISFNTLLLIIFLVGVGFYFLGTPRTGDDYTFLEFFKPWLDSQPEILNEQGFAMVDKGGNIFKYGFPIDEYVETIKNRYEGNNIRLANITAIFFLILPRWIGPLITLLLIFLIVRESFRMADLDPDSSPLMPIYLGLFTILIWNGDALNEFDFQVNYLWGVFVAVMLLRCLRSQKRGIASSIILGVVMGWWHEGLALPILVGLVTMCIVFRECRQKKYYAAIVAMAIGFGFQVMSPGTQERINGGFVSLSYMFSIETVKMIIRETVFFWIALLLALIAAIRVGWRRVFCDRLVLFLLVSSFVSLCVLCRTFVFSRSGFWMYYAIGVMIIRLFAIISPNFSSRYNCKNLAVGIPLLLLIYTHWGYVSYYSVRINKIVNEQLALWFEHPGETRFADVIPLQEMPLMCGNFQLTRYCLMPYFDFIKLYYAPDIEKRYGKSVTGYDEMMSLIPERLRDVTVDSGRAMPGGSPIREYKGLLFMPETEFVTQVLKKLGMTRWEFTISCDYGKGYVNRNVYLTSFISEADGKRYCYVEPIVIWYVAHFKSIKRISPDMTYQPIHSDNSSTY
ncbi:MAG: hypothetical protein ACI304_03695 [Lepagella sp.]